MGLIDDNVWKLLFVVGSLIILAAVNIAFTVETPGLYCDGNKTYCDEDSRLYLNESYVVTINNDLGIQEYMTFDYTIWPGDNVTSDIVEAPDEFYDFDIR